MKILTARKPGYATQIGNEITAAVGADLFGQWLIFDDGSRMFDDFSQTSAILTAEQYNGRAALTDDGVWIPAPGLRNHDHDYTLLGFHVGMTMLGVDSLGKAIYDYTVVTPTGIAFHGDGKHNTLHVPTHWRELRIAAEMISWICLGEDTCDDMFPEDTTPEQWGWIRGQVREYCETEINEWIEEYDRNGGIVEESAPEAPVSTKEALLELAEIGNTPEVREHKIEKRAKEYAEHRILACQSNLVADMLDINFRVSWEEVVNLDVDVASMDGYALATFIDEEMTQDWRKLDIVDITDYAYEDDEGNEPDYDTALADLNPLDLEEYDLEALREYIRENYESGEIFSWYLVDEWLAEELEKEGEATLTDNESHWWGRRTYGQLIIQDGILQRIAAKHIE